VITHLLSSTKKTDLFKDAGSIDAVANVVDKFEKTVAECLQRSIFDQWRIVKVKVDEDGLGQWVALQPRRLQ